MVFAPVGGERVVAVDQTSALEEVAHAVEAVVVQAVGEECLFAVFHHHALTHFRNLRFAVIMQAVSLERQGVALDDAHVAKGVERL